MEPYTVGLLSAGVQAETGPSDPSEKRTQVPHPESSRPLPPAQRDGRSGTAALSWRPLLNRLRHLRQDRQMDFLPIPAHANPTSSFESQNSCSRASEREPGSGRKRQRGRRTCEIFTLGRGEQRLCQPGFFLDLFMNTDSAKPA